MTESKMSADEVFESLTGFDEIAIAQTFGLEVLELGERKPMTFTRSLAFTLFRRDGLSDSDAKNKVMGMSIKDVQALFEDDANEVDPSDPVTEQGKDVTPSV